MPTRILVIDDDMAIRLSLSIVLQAKGYEVLLAEDGGQGLAQFLAHRPDIVLSDMIMPGHEGILTISRIRELSPDLPIVAMSGSIQGGPASFVQRAFAAGANMCLEKPFDTEELLRVLGGLTQDGEDE